MEDKKVMQARCDGTHLESQQKQAELCGSRPQWVPGQLGLHSKPQCQKHKWGKGSYASQLFSSIEWSRKNQKWERVTFLRVRSLVSALYLPSQYSDATLGKGHTRMFWQAQICTVTREDSGTTCRRQCPSCQSGSEDWTWVVRLDDNYLSCWVIFPVPSLEIFMFKGFQRHCWDCATGLNLTSQINSTYKFMMEFSNVGVL